MGNKIICIGREFGSGGHEVAILLSQRLGIKVYEKELVRLACTYGEVAVKTLEGADEKATNPYLFRIVHEGNHRVSRGLPTSEVLFQLQSHEIRRIAEREDCIFVGRCADYALKDTDVHILSAFIAAPEEQRIQRKMQQENLTHGKAKRLVHKMDKQRKKYYENYTQSKWGKAGDYDLYFNSGEMSLEEIAEQLASRYREL